MNLNNQIVEGVLNAVLQRGVVDFCLCPGARNAPFVYALTQYDQNKVFHFFEERSAAFFALGRAQRTQRPVAIITTSGTAVAELLPAAVEATYTGTPLIFITADRPKSFRKTGAPQTIEQIGIFSNYVEKTWDIDQQNWHIDFDQASWKMPIHLNVCLEEPQKEADYKYQFHLPQIFQVPQKSIDAEAIELENPIVILGSLSPQEQIYVSQFLQENDLPVFAEAVSCLRTNQKISDKLISVADKTINEGIKQGLISSVVRIGGVPTLRFWRDLEEKYSQLPVYNFSSLSFSGLARNSKTLNIENLVYLKTHWQKDIYQKVLSISYNYEKKLQQLLTQLPQSEVAMIYKLSSVIDGDVYLGNSLPIREWDLVANKVRGFEGQIHANRGANGIDGQLSSFMGWLKSDVPAWAIVGDLTTLYDLTAPWIFDRLGDSQARIVIVNNGGGKIFEKMFSHKNFLNSHQLQFHHWAKMWNWDYQVWSSIPDKVSLSSKKMIIELQPNPEQSAQFWQEFEKF